MQIRFCMITNSALEGIIPLLWLLSKPLTEFLNLWILINKHWVFSSIFLKLLIRSGMISFWTNYLIMAFVAYHWNGLDLFLPTDFSLSVMLAPFLICFPFSVWFPRSPYLALC